MIRRIVRSLLGRSRYAWRLTGGRLAEAVSVRSEPARIVRRWKLEGRPVPPPPEVKRRMLRSYIRQYGVRTFVETGTFMGDTSAAIAPYVDRVITIELSSDLAERARRRFAEMMNVRVVEGDSKEVLPELLATIVEPALFWLDGHYSAGVTARGTEDTPVRGELQAILGHQVHGHVILIDDAREFTGGAYPSVDEVAAAVRGHPANYVLEVRDDIVRLTPSAQSR